MSGQQRGWRRAAPQTPDVALAVETADADATRAFAAWLARRLRPGDALGLVGGLGAGKTTFVQGLACGLGLPAHVSVRSPTFALCCEYPTVPPLAHFDLYRIEDAGELDELGLEERLGGEEVVAAEWFDRWPELAPPEWLELRFVLLGGERRRIECAPHGPDWRARLDSSSEDASPL